ncbi:MAG: hypothetical protein IIB95_14360 [Candidatus Marinimicrobia bacterium]|nr:hypothetical protein [Candidatus Neomarinimicrobiota bacterium]
MSRIKDNWFIQDDIIHNIEEIQSFSGEYLKIFESINNSFEYLKIQSYPIHSKKIASIMESPNWGGEDTKSRKKILFQNNRHFLSVSFRRFFKLKFDGYKYCNSTNHIYGKQIVIDNISSKTIRYYARADSIRKYINATDQVLVFGIYSTRFTERLLEDYKWTNKRKYDDTNNYSINYRNISKGSDTFHPRVKSLSHLSGKFCLLNS